MARDVQSLWAADAHCWSQPVRYARAQKARGVVDSLSKCVAAVWEAAKGTLTASQRVVVEQPTAQSERKQLEQEVAAIQARERQPKAAQGSGGCMLPGGRNGRQSQGTENASAAGVCGGSVGNVQSSRLSPHWLWCGVGEEGEETWPHCCRSWLQPSAHPEPGPGCFPGYLHACFPGAASPRNAACASNALCDCAERGRGNHSCCPSPASRHSSGPHGRGSLELWCSCLLAITVSSNLEQLLWQEVENKSRHGPQGVQVVSQQQPQQQCTQSTLDIPNAQSTPTHPQSASPGTACLSASSPAVAVPVELCTSTGSGGAPDGNTEGASMGGILRDEELMRVFESIDGGEDRSHVERARREALDVVQLVIQGDQEDIVGCLVRQHHRIGPSRNG